MPSNADQKQQQPHGRPNFLRSEQREKESMHRHDVERVPRDEHEPIQAKEQERGLVSGAAYAILAPH